MKTRKTTQSLFGSKTNITKRGLGLPASAIVLGIALAAGALIVPSGHAQSANGEGATALPPQSHAFGETAGAWLQDMIAGTEIVQGKPRLPWQIEDEKVSATGSGTFDDPVSISISGNVNRKPGQALLLFPAGYRTTTAYPYVVPDTYWGFGNYVTIEVVLDGKTVVSAEDCADYYVPPQYYDPPLADGTIEVQGFFCILPPLSVGVHTLLMHDVFMLPPGSVGVGPLGLGEDVVETLTLTVAP